ncbi:MAG TPA: arylsulfatase [Spirochaetia bacterium]|nr:arylsulfatase [Spirochaetia bacterium]
MSDRPNIVYIMADDMGYGDLGSYGALKTRTPNMDRIARNGARFVDMHSGSAVCTPSRYGVLTGRYCWRTWLQSFVLGGFGSPLIEPERPTIASMLKEKGYRTGAVGKWHVGLNWWTRNGSPLAIGDRDGWNTDGFEVDYSRGVSGGPNDLGFDHWFGIAGSLDMPPYCFIENSRTVETPTVEKRPYNPQQRRGLMVEGWRDDQVDIRFAEEAVRFIDGCASASSGQPFFLYLTPSAPHRPNVPPEFMLHTSEGGLREDMVMMVDWMVGEVMAALEKHGLLENTLVMVTSDNGARAANFDGKDYGHKPNGDWRGQKGDIYDGGHREPFVAQWPGVVPAGTVCNEPLVLNDVFATLAEISGYRVPESGAEDSVSFLDHLKGTKSAKPLHKAVIHHSLNGMFSVRLGDWKLIQGLGSGGFTEPQTYQSAAGEAKGQLYNIADDHHEMINHWLLRQDVVEEFTKVLDGFVNERRSR